MVSKKVGKGVDWGNFYIKVDFLTKYIPITMAISDTNTLTNTYNYKIFDSRNLASASQVAAGFINPVTGKWMTESWKIDTLMPKAKAFYQDIEERLGINIVQDLPIRRYFINQEDSTNVL